MDIEVDAKAPEVCTLPAPVSILHLTNPTHEDLPRLDSLINVMEAGDGLTRRPAGPGKTVGKEGAGPGIGGGAQPGRTERPHSHKNRKTSPLVTCNAARERTRVKTLRTAFHELQQALPCVPPNTKLSKLDVLVLATMYIAHLMSTLQQGATPGDHGIQAGAEAEAMRAGSSSGSHRLSAEYLHPVKKWPMRTRLYAGLAARARGSPPLCDSHGAHQAAVHTYL